MSARYRPRQLVGKYRIRKRIATGGFAVVYRAQDTVEGVDVALKIPHRHLMSALLRDSVKREARLVARLDHPNVLPLKNATFINDDLVIATPLGGGTLTDRLKKRLGPKLALDYCEQALEGLAYAHEQKIIHCDIKPDNMILFEGNRLRISDFGIAKIAQHTRSIDGAGTGTVGFLAPEQALGKPSLRSDVFAMGLVMHRLFAGTVPEWPFDWPAAGNDRFKRVASPSLIALVKKSLSLRERHRYTNAVEMRNAFRRIKRRALR